MNETRNTELPVAEATEVTLVPFEGTDGVEVVAFLQEGEGEVAATVADEAVD